MSKTTAANLWVKATLQSSSTVFATSGMITVQSSTEGSVTLSLSTTTPKSGEALMATVKFTSLSPPPYSTNTQVIIKSDNPGVIANTSGTIDSQGNAYIMLTVSTLTSGTARVNLWAEVGSSKSPISLVTVSATGSVGTGALTLSVSPATAIAGDSVFATIKYTNAEASNLSGQTITIISNKPQIIASNLTGVTDSSGQVVITLPIAATAQSTSVTLYATGAGTVSTTATVTVSSSTVSAGSLQLNSPIAATNLAFNSSLPISVKVMDSLGTTAIPNAAVTFSLTDVAGAVVPAATAYLLTNSVTSDNSGVAQTTLYSRSTATNLIVSATATISGAARKITFPLISITNGASNLLRLSATKLSIPSWTGTTAGVVGSLIGGGTTSTITASLTDAQGTAVPDGTLLTFTTTGGSFVTNSCVTTSGKCDVTWRNTNPIPANGRAVITATSGAVTQTETIIMASVQPQVTTTCASIPFNVGGLPRDTQCTVTVSDLLGNTMAGGTKVSFTALANAPAVANSMTIVTPTTKDYTFADSNAPNGQVIQLVIRNGGDAVSGALQVETLSGGVWSTYTFPLTN